MARTEDADDRLVVDKTQPVLSDKAAAATPGIDDFDDLEDDLEVDSDVPWSRNCLSTNVATWPY